MQTAKLARLALKVIALQMFAQFLSRRMTTWTHILVPSSLDISAQFAKRRVLQLDIVSLRVVCLRFALILQEIQTTSAFMKHGARHYKFL
ncbi:hypothetical protein EV702DRAFT_1136836 [Suillus placidus]|uniref:Secreted protein n=1 Tax=Suillus placidus TaxID=48579 RepID=A0A9P7CYJ8_9AGAM|nr:hypothetical protein EV702DRAFT_1136836 [Suillus placidus]